MVGKGVWALLVFLKPAQQAVWPKVWECGLGLLTAWSEAECFHLLLCASYFTSVCFDFLTAIARDSSGIVISINYVSNTHMHSMYSVSSSLGD